MMAAGDPLAHVIQTELCLRAGFGIAEPSPLPSPRGRGSKTGVFRRFYPSNKPLGQYECA